MHGRLRNHEEEIDKHSIRTKTPMKKKGKKENRDTDIPKIA
jgi:hypothetical protein